MNKKKIKIFDFFYSTKNQTLPKKAKVKLHGTPNYFN